MILYTSGTLPKQKETEQLLDIKFGISKNFKLMKEHKLYLSTVRYVNNKIFRLSYKIYKKH